MTTPPNKINLTLADDDPIARAGIRSLLSQAEDIDVIGEAQDGFEAQRLVAELHPRILLLDLKMPGPRPAEIEKWVRENYPCTDTLVLTSHDRNAYLASMMDSGAAGYLSKGDSADQLIGAIRRAAQGEIVFDDSQISRADQWRKEVGEKLNQLTPQERKVLELLAKGMNSKSIASSLDISVKTVSYHITNVLAKLNVSSRQEATIWALKHLSDDLE